MELYHGSGREDKSMVYEVLKIGEKNALSPDYLRATLGLTSNRAVQKQIEHERRQGKVILSSTQPPGGYFLPETKQEIRRFIRTLENRGSKTLDAINGARALLNTFDEAEEEKVFKSLSKEKQSELIVRKANFSKAAEIYL